MPNRYRIYASACILSFLTIFFSCINQKHKQFDLTDETYYISSSGNDMNPGTMYKPWKTIEKINSIRLNPGTRIFFEGGKVFNGTLLLDSLDKGSMAKNITISSFGRERAVIDGGNSQGIRIINCGNFTIKNLIVKGTGRKEGNTEDGVLISDSRNYVLDSLEVYGFQHSGIHVHVGSDVKISNIYAHDNGFAGINITGTTIYSKSDFDNENIYIGYSVAENNPGDPTVTDNHSGNGILASSVRNGTIEYCEAFNNGWDMQWTGNGPVGIWIWDCTAFTIQNCISHDNKTNPVAKDGGGFDLDGGVSNSVIQYCLSYNNQGPGYGLFEFGAAKVWENNILRYNISRNDGLLNSGSLAVWKGDGAGPMRNCEVFNNTFLNDTSGGISLSVMSNCPGFNFRNNIFIYKDHFLLPGQKLLSELFQGNCYWNTSGDKTIAGYSSLSSWAKATGNETVEGELVGIYADPLLDSHKEIAILTNANIKRSALTGYIPEVGSPLADHGLDLRKRFNLDAGRRDITGTTIPQNSRYDIGAVERAGN